MKIRPLLIRGLKIFLVRTYRDLKVGECLIRLSLYGLIIERKKIRAYCIAETCTFVPLFFLSETSPKTIVSLQNSSIALVTNKKRRFARVFRFFVAPVGTYISCSFSCRLNAPFFAFLDSLASTAIFFGPFCVLFFFPLVIVPRFFIPLLAPVSAREGVLPVWHQERTEHQVLVRFRPGGAGGFRALQRGWRGTGRPATTAAVSEHVVHARSD